MITKHEIQLIGSHDIKRHQKLQSRSRNSIILKARRREAKRDSLTENGLQRVYRLISSGGWNKISGTLLKFWPNQENREDRTNPSVDMRREGRYPPMKRDIQTLPIDPRNEWLDWGQDVGKCGKCLSGNAITAAWITIVCSVVCWGRIIALSMDNGIEKVFGRWGGWTLGRWLIGWKLRWCIFCLIYNVALI